MPKSLVPENIAQTLFDPLQPKNRRLALLRDVAGSNSPEAAAILGATLDAAALGAAGDEAVDEAASRYQAMCKELESGVARPATFLGFVAGPAVANQRRAYVVLHDGTFACPWVPVAAGDPALEPMDGVLVDGRATAVIGRDGNLPPTGEVARLRRRVDPGRVEVELRSEEVMTMRIKPALRRQLDSGAFPPNSTLVVNPRAQVAFEALAPADGLAHFEFLDRAPIPDVVIERDIGAAHPVIREMLEHCRLELGDTARCRRYRQSPSKFVLLQGVSGSGKSHAIDGILRGVAEIESALTGAPLGALPPRRIRLNMSTVLSHFLGQSDKRLARVFDELEQIARTPFEWQGRTYRLSVQLILEECDAAARQRGQDHDGIYDRIFSTLLQRLDPRLSVFQEHCCLVMATTNCPTLLDAAFTRRAGGTIATFGRLTRRAPFRAVLLKHLRGVPLALPGTAEGDAARLAADRLAAWLYAPNSAVPALLDVTLAGSTRALAKGHKDFMTAAIVARAVQAAAACACQRASQGIGPEGVTLSELQAAFDRQCQELADLVTPRNAADYVDVPADERVAVVRRLPRAALTGYELEREVA